MLLADNHVQSNLEEMSPKGSWQTTRSSGVDSARNSNSMSDALPRWQEKTMPFFLILLGLTYYFFYYFKNFWFIYTVPIIFNPIGLMGITSGIGLFWHKEWARRIGLIFAGLLEITGFESIYSWFFICLGTIGHKVQPDLNTFFGFFYILIAIYLLKILSGCNLATRIGVTGTRPPAIWMIFFAYTSTIIGILPAIVLLTRKPVARSLAQAYTIFLMILFSIIGLLFTADLPIFLWFVVFFLIMLCFLAFISLSKPDIRAFFENSKI